MANNFSVEWLSKSYYTTVQRDDGEGVVETTARLEDAPFPEKVQPERITYSKTAQFKDSGNRYLPTSPNNSCGYASGSESEVGEDSEGEAGLSRRTRTKFTSEQIGKLESTFSTHKYLGATQRRKIAEKLSLSETQIKTWFQNRRMKLKRELQDLRPEFFSAPPGLMPHQLYAPSFQHLAGGQFPVHSRSGFYPQPVHGLPFPAQHTGQGPLQLHPAVLPSSYYY